MSGAHRYDGRFLIVAGTQKAGTTALFDYLAGHPQICPSLTKEPWYFVDAAYPIASPVRQGRDPLASYLALFPCAGPERVCLEATPGYLHDDGAPQRIAQALPRARVVVTLRDPVERLISLYSWNKLFGAVAEEVSLADYLRHQLAGATGRGISPEALAGLAQGRYSVPLQAYFEKLGRNRVLVTWFDTLRERPAAVMQAICAHAGIDGAYFDGYAFEPRNEARQWRIRSFLDRYLALKARVKRRLGPLPGLGRLLHRIEPAMYQAMSQPARREQAPPDLLQQVRDYYTVDIEPLQRLLGETPPWAAAWGRAGRQTPPSGPAGPQDAS